MNHDSISQVRGGILTGGHVAQPSGAWKSGRPWQLTWRHSLGENLVASLKGWERRYFLSKGSNTSSSATENHGALTSRELHRETCLV